MQLVIYVSCHRIQWLDETGLESLEDEKDWEERIVSDVAEIDIQLWRSWILVVGSTVDVLADGSGTNS